MKEMKQLYGTVQKADIQYSEIDCVAQKERDRAHINILLLSWYNVKKYSGKVLR